MIAMRTWLKEQPLSILYKALNITKSKTRTWTKDISKARNMEYIPEEDAFTCAKGRKLTYAFTRKCDTQNRICI